MITSLSLLTTIVSCCCFWVMVITIPFSRRTDFFAMNSMIILIITPRSVSVLLLLLLPLVLISILLMVDIAITSYGYIKLSLVFLCVLMCLKISSALLWLPAGEKYRGAWHVGCV